MFKQHNSKNWGGLGLGKQRDILVHDVSTNNCAEKPRQKDIYTKNSAIYSQGGDNQRQNKHGA